MQRGAVFSVVPGLLVEEPFLQRQTIRAEVARQRDRAQHGAHEELLEVLALLASGKELDALRWMDQRQRQDRARGLLPDWSV